MIKQRNFKFMLKSVTGFLKESTQFDQFFMKQDLIAQVILLGVN